MPTALAVPGRTYTVLERTWLGETVVCLGCGPSLTQADVDLVRGRARVIAINTAYTLAPWADVLYACDSKWWFWHQGAKDFPGRKLALTPEAQRHFPDVELLRNSGPDGLELKDRGAVRAGSNSGHQAINVAVHLGASRILLLGYDMRGGHFHAPHPDGSAPPFTVCLARFRTLAAALPAGVQVLNCTRRTALTCFPCVPLEDALAQTSGREEACA
jgi:hypothetical protein